MTDTNQLIAEVRERHPGADIHPLADQAGIERAKGKDEWTIQRIAIMHPPSEEGFYISTPETPYPLGSGKDEASAWQAAHDGQRSLERGMEKVLEEQKAQTEKEKKE